MSPCFLAGRFSRFVRSRSSDVAMYERVSAGSMMASTKRRAAAMEARANLRYVVANGMGLGNDISLLG